MLPSSPSVPCSTGKMISALIRSPLESRMKPGLWASRISPSALPCSMSFVTFDVKNHWPDLVMPTRSEEHTSELQSQSNLVCRLLLEKKKKNKKNKKMKWKIEYNR